MKTSIYQLSHESWCFAKCGWHYVHHRHYRHARVSEPQSRLSGLPGLVCGRQRTITCGPAAGSRALYHHPSPGQGGADPGRPVAWVLAFMAGIEDPNDKLLAEVALNDTVNWGAVAHSSRVSLRSWA